MQPLGSELLAFLDRKIKIRRNLTTIRTDRTMKRMMQQLSALCSTLWFSLRSNKISVHFVISTEQMEGPSICLKSIVICSARLPQKKKKDIYGITMSWCLSQMLPANPYTANSLSALAIWQTPAVQILFQPLLATSPIHLMTANSLSPALDRVW